MPARAGTDRTSQEGRADAHAGRRQHRGGDRLGGGRPSAQRPEGGCLPYEEAPASLAALGGWLVVNGCLSCCNGMDVVGCYM